MRSLVRMLVLGLVLAGLVPVAPVLAQPSDTTLQRDQLEAPGKQFAHKQVPSKAVRRGTRRPKGPTRG